MWLKLKNIKIQKEQKEHSEYSEKHFLDEQIQQPTLIGQSINSFLLQ